MRYLITIDVPDRSMLTLAASKLREIGCAVERMVPAPMLTDRQFSGHNLDCEPIHEHPFDRSVMCRVCGRESTDDVHTDHVGCSTCGAEREPAPIRDALRQISGHNLDCPKDCPRCEPIPDVGMVCIRREGAR